MSLDELIDYLSLIRDEKGGDLKVFLPCGFRYWRNEYTSNAPAEIRKSHVMLREESYVTEDLNDTDLVMVLGYG